MATPRAPLPTRSFSSLLALLAGLSLGGGAVWAFRFHSSAPPLPALSATSSRPSAPDPSYISHSTSHIRLLPAAKADAALAGYLALPPLAIDASEADFAERAQRLRALLATLPADRVAQLVTATASRLGLGESRLRLIAITTWVDVDAPAAARWAATSQPGPALDTAQLAHFASAAALAWARTDFADAYDWAASLADTKLGLEVRRDLLARLAFTDPDRALSLARAGDLALFDAVGAPIFFAWLEHDPAAAFAALGPEVLLRPDQRQGSLPRALARWAASDPAAAFAWFDAQGLGRTNQESGLASWIVGILDRQEPPPDFHRLAALLGDRAARGLGRKELSPLLRSWMSRNSTAALAWLDRLPDASLRAEVLDNAVHEAGYRAPSQALALASHLPAGAPREQKLSELFAQWSERDPDAALAWLDGPEGDAFAATPGAQAAHIGALARHDPATALAHWQSLASEELRRATAPAIARAWSVAAPDAATAWLFAQIPEGPHIDDRETRSRLAPAQNSAETARTLEHWTQLLALKQSSSAWIARDPAGYLAWAESHPSPVQRQAALHALAWPDHPAADVDFPDPAERLALLASVRDTAARRALQRGYLVKWNELDPAAALRWAGENSALDLLAPPKRGLLDLLGLPSR